MKNDCPISVVIPAFGSSAKLRETLRRVLACRPLPAEVLLHFDGGWEPDFDPAHDAPIPVRVLRSSTNRGPGGGRDACIRAAAHDLVASFDDDSWPLDEDYFARACAVMAAFPQAVVMSPAVFVEEVPVAPPLAEVNEARCFEGSASITRRSLYLTLPGYVPVPQAYGIEEADLALQAHAAGLLVLACPWLRAWHDRPQADHLHAEFAWMRNEVLLGYLRFPRAAQPWAWWRALRRAWRLRGVLGMGRCASALIHSIPHCATYSRWKQRMTWSGLRRHHCQQRQRWVLEPGDEGVRVTRDTTSRRILFAQYTNPSVYPPLEHATKILSRRGWEVLCLGMEGRFGTVLDWPARDRVTIRRMRRCEPGFRQKLHYLAFLIWVVMVTRRWKAEWVYLSDQLATPVFEWLRRFTSARIVYHEHDSPPRDGYSTGWFIEKVLRDRLRTARECEVLVLPNEQRLEALVAASGRTTPACTVWNCPCLDEVGPPRETSVTERPLEVLYHGSIGPSGYPQWVLNSVAAVRPQVRMTLVGYELPGSMGWSAQLQERAAELGFKAGFERLPAMPRWRLLRFCGGKDVGLGVLNLDLTNINLRFLAGASNKPFDYLSQGVVPVVADREEWVDLMVNRGCAVACSPDDPASLTRALAELAAHPDQVRQMGERGRQLVLTEWNYEKQFAGVLAVLEGNPAAPASNSES